MNGKYYDGKWNYEYQMIIKISLCFNEFSEVSAINRYYFCNLKIESCEKNKGVSLAFPEGVPRK